MKQSQKKKVIYCLTWLYKNLCAAGLNKLCLRHEISTGLEDLHIVYLDSLLQERFITIYRSCENRYRIRYNSSTYFAKTAKGATELVLKILHETLAQSGWSKVMTVYEFATKDTVSHGDSLRLYTRSTDRKGVRK